MRPRKSPYTPSCTRINGIWYQGWDVQGQWIMAAFRVPHSGKGRRVQRPPVVGGRWKIRRSPLNPKLPWRAWTDGKAKQWNRKFATHAEAVKWAHKVAEQYRLFDQVTANANLGLILRYEWAGHDEEYISAP